MFYLVIVSFIWAFSFGLIKGRLTAFDPTVISFIRLGLSFLVFLPLLKLKELPKNRLLQLALVGAVQYGLMYIAYINSFKYLKAHEVALFTVLTPLYVVLIADALAKQISLANLLAASLSVVGAATISLTKTDLQFFWTGFFWVQVSNICFAAGQILYKKFAAELRLQQYRYFAVLYFGAVCVTLVAAIASGNLGQILSFNKSDVLALIYLGVLASGVCFFLWNLGATKVNTATLAIFNNLKVPLGIICSILFFKEQSNPLKLIAGCCVIGVALLFAQRAEKAHIKKR